VIVSIAADHAGPGTLRAMRIAIPLVLAVLCLAATFFTGAVLTVVLMIVALCLVLDGATKWFSRSGGLSENRQ
jgi:hypothetical protein